MARAIQILPAELNRAVSPNALGLAGARVLRRADTVRPRGAVRRGPGAVGSSVAGADATVQNAFVARLRPGPRVVLDYTGGGDLRGTYEPSSDGRTPVLSGSVAGGTVSLTWSCNENDLRGFAVERKDYPDGGWRQVGTGEGDGYSEAVGAGAGYAWRVRGYRETSPHGRSGWTQYSNEYRWLNNFFVYTQQIVGFPDDAKLTPDGAQIMSTLVRGGASGYYGYVYRRSAITTNFAICGAEALGIMEFLVYGDSVIAAMDYDGTLSARLYRSLDYGRTFTPWKEVVFASGGWRSFGIIDTGAALLWHILGEPAVGPGSQYIYRSTDGGATWGLVATLPLGTVVRTKRGGARLLNIGGGVVLSYYYSGGQTWTVRSTDHGATWGAATAISAYQIDVPAVNASKIFLGVVGYSRILRSGDAGLSWDAVLPLPGDSHIKLGCVHDGLFYCMSDDTLARSADGDSWETVPSDLGSYLAMGYQFFGMAGSILSVFGASSPYQLWEHIG